MQLEIDGGVIPGELLNRIRAQEGLLGVRWIGASVLQLETN